MTTVPVDTPDPLLVAMERNLHGHFAFLHRRLPGMTVRDRPDLLLVDSGLPSDTFNQIARARLPARGADRRIAGAIGHFRDAGRPFSWWVGPGSRPLHLERLLEGHGLRAREPETGMALELERLGPGGSPPEGLVVRRAGTAAEVADFAAVVEASWVPPDPAVGAFYGAATALLLERECPVHLFVGYLTGAPVATSELFVGGGVCGVYSVITLEPYRRRGIGTAVTRAALEEGRRLGLGTATLQASAMGRSVYARLGFRECGPFVEYA